MPTYMRTSSDFVRWQQQPVAALVFVS